MLINDGLLSQPISSADLQSQYIKKFLLRQLLKFYDLWQPCTTAQTRSSVVAQRLHNALCH